MEPAEYDYMFRLEETLWWFVAMRRIAYGLLKGELKGASRLSILDAGCGTGGQLPLLERFGSVTSFDFTSMATELFVTRQKGRILQASIDAIPFADASFDLVTSFEVICQLPAPADEVALQEMARVLRPGGTLMVRLPAFQALHGPHDQFLLTQHRYSKPELTRKIESTGLEMVKASYLNTLLFPVAATRRLVSKLLGRPPTDSDVRPVPEAVNRLFTLLLSAEGPILQRTNLPFGLSVLAIARKP